MKQTVNRNLRQIIVRSSKRLTLTVLALTLMSAWAVSQTTNSAIPIGAARVTFDYSVVNASGYLDAFIPTGSLSPLCLVTLSESNAYFVGPSPTICVPREFNGQKGIRISVIPYFASFPADMILMVTAYQQSARRYGQPVLYTGP